MAGIKGHFFDAASATMILFVEVLMPGLDELAKGNGKELAEFVLVSLALILSMCSTYMLIHRLIRLCIRKIDLVDGLSICISVLTIVATLIEYFNAVKAKKKNGGMRVASISLVVVAFFSISFLSHPLLVKPSRSTEQSNTAINLST